MNINLSGQPVARASLLAIKLATVHGNDQPIAGTIDSTGGTSRLWSSTIGSIHRPIAIHDDSFISSSEDGTLQAQQLGTGELRWSHRFGAPIGTPVMNDAVVYISAAGRMLALDADSGLIAWAARSTAAGFTDPVICDDVLYTCGQDGMVLAIEPLTGELFWQAQASGCIETAPIFADDLVIVRTETGSLEALDVITGEHRWQLSVGWSFDPAHMTIAGHMLITNGPGGRVIAVDSTTGMPRWETDLDGLSGDMMTIDGLVIVAGTLPDRSTELVAFAVQSGIRIWSHIIPAGISSDLQAYGIMLLAGDRSGRVHVIDSTNGVASCVVHVEETRVISTVMYLRETLFVGTSTAALADLIPQLSWRTETNQYQSPPSPN